MTAWFACLATRCSRATGSWQAFVAALAVVLIWFVCGFFVGFGNTLYQLIINTGTTIVTFLMVFLLQQGQMRDTATQNLKLDAIIHALDQADDRLMAVEMKTDAEVAALKQGLLGE